MQNFIFRITENDSEIRKKNNVASPATMIPPKIKNSIPFFDVMIYYIYYHRFVKVNSWQSFFRTSSVD